MKKQTIIKALLLITMISIAAFGDVSFAAENDATDLTLMVTLFINLFLRVCSRLWVIFAYLAGHFLSNARVYGAVIGMDMYLRRCRNIMKNLANFALGAVFVFYLFKALFLQEQVDKIIKDILIKIIVAGIGIQASWFLVAATLDISTIAMSAVGSIPAQLIATDTRLTEGMMGGKIGALHQNSLDMSREIDKKFKIDLFPEEGATVLKLVSTTAEDTSTSYTMENLVDKIQPNPESLAGPLIFLGINIIQTQEVETVDLSSPGKSFIKILLSA